MIWNLPKDCTLISTKEKLRDQLFANRQILSAQEQQDFLDPKLTNYLYEFDLPGISKAVDRIKQAIAKQQLIIIYGDYDVDGIAAAAVMYHGLTSLGAKVFPYIPHREKEGYGLSKIGLDLAKEKGAELVITVDNGIVAIEQARYAQKLGLDLIITDHHVSKEEKPQALSIVHSTNICGAAVAWSVVRQLLKDDESAKLLDLVAIATVCDLISLKGVNRALVKEGLNILNKTPRLGIKALIDEAALYNDIITAYHISHILGPRLNAIGRLEHAIDALRLLCTKNIDRAKRLAKLLCETNDHKKKITFEAITEAKEMISGQLLANKERKILIVDSNKWIPGVIGLVAGKIAQEYRMPAIAISIQGDYAKGSARSVDGINIVEIIRECGDLFVDVGGHPQAAGFTLKSENISEFKQRMDDLMKEKFLETELKIEVEGLLDINFITRDWYDTVSQFSPFGIGNPRPVFVSRDILISDLRVIGDAGDHLKFKTQNGLECIAFSLGRFAKELENGDRIDIAYYLDLNKFNGWENLQLKVIDLKKK